MGLEDGIYHQRSIFVRLYQLSELEEADARNVVDVPRQRHPTVDEDSQIADTVNELKIDFQNPHAGTAAVMQTMARAQP